MVRRPIALHPEKGKIVFTRKPYFLVGMALKALTKIMTKFLRKIFKSGWQIFGI